MKAPLLTCLPSKPVISARKSASDMSLEELRVLVALTLEHGHRLIPKSRASAALPASVQASQSKPPTFAALISCGTHVGHIAQQLERAALLRRRAIVDHRRFNLARQVGKDAGFLLQAC